MLCPKCGMENNEEALYCGGCGAPLREPQEKPAQEQTSQYQQPQYQRPQYQQPQYQQPQYQQPRQSGYSYTSAHKKKSKAKPWIIAGAAVLAVVLAVVLIVNLCVPHCKIEYDGKAAEILNRESGLKSALQKAVDIYASLDLGDLVDMQYPAARKYSEEDRMFLDGMGRMAKENNSKVLGAEVRNIIRLSYNSIEHCEQELSLYAGEAITVQDGYEIRAFIKTEDGDGRGDNFTETWKFVKIDNHWYLVNIG